MARKYTGGRDLNLCVLNNGAVKSDPMHCAIISDTQKATSTPK
jgi:hypothetical protein